MFDDLYMAQKNATCDAKCNEISDIEISNVISVKTWLFRKSLGTHVTGDRSKSRSLRGNTEAVNQGGNRRAVESEWRKEMGIDEADRGEKMDARGQGAIVEESGQAQACVSLPNHACPNS
jgi:hypothetical protein